MKYKFCLIILVSFLFQFGYAQQLFNETSKLESLSKIWGFLKYYHPQVAEGNYNWDEELIKILPNVRNSKNKEELSKLYFEWIESLGEIKNCRKCEIKDFDVYLNKNFDLSWTQDNSMFSAELSNLLKYIENNRYLKGNFYVESTKLGNINITNEFLYDKIDFPNEDFRLLALFRYWNIIEYFYPYKYLTDQDWDDVLLEMIPKFINVHDSKKYHLALRELVSKLDDSHAWIDLNQTKKYLPSKFKYIDSKIIVSELYNDSLAKINDLQKGDNIIMIGNENLVNLLSKNSKYNSGSNEKTKMISTAYDLLSGEENSINLTIERNGDTLTKKIKRYDFKEFDYWENNASEKWKILDNNIGYVKVKNIKKDDIEMLFESILKSKAIIFDLRGYPRHIYRAISNKLNSEQKEFAKVYKPDLTYPGRFVWDDVLTTGIKNNQPYEGKVVLLVDEETKSLSEFTVMSFQTAENVTTIGSQTAGADGEVSIFNFVGGFKTAMSGRGYLYPDGTVSQRNGVKIDITVEKSIRALREGKDEVLERAIEFIESN